MKQTKKGVINRLIGGVTDKGTIAVEDEVVDPVEDLKKAEEEVKEKIENLNSCPPVELKNFTDTFNNWLMRTFKSDKKSNDIKTHITYYTARKPNNKGTYISDFDIVVENEEMPFSSLDRVNYFLENYIGMIENERLANGHPEKKDRSMFFNKIKKTIPHYTARVDSQDKRIIGGKKKSKTPRNHKTRSYKGKKKNRTVKHKDHKNKKYKGGTSDEKEAYVKEAIGLGAIDQLERALKVDPNLANESLLKYAEDNSDVDNKEDIIGIIQDTMNKKE